MKLFSFNKLLVIEAILLFIALGFLLTNIFLKNRIRMLEKDIKALNIEKANYRISLMRKSNVNALNQKSQDFNMVNINQVNSIKTKASEFSVIGERRTFSSIALNNRKKFWENHVQAQKNNLVLY